MVVVASTFILTLIVTVSENDLAALVPVWLLTIALGLVFAIAVVPLTALLGFPLWRLLHRKMGHLPNRIALMIGAEIIALLAGAVLGVVSLFDLDLAVNSVVDLAVFVIVGGVCGTLVAWRIYADWL